MRTSLHRETVKTIDVSLQVMAELPDVQGRLLQGPNLKDEEGIRGRERAREWHCSQRNASSKIVHMIIGIIVRPAVIESQIFHNIWRDCPRIASMFPYHPSP